MVAATVLAVLLVPTFFVVVSKLFQRRSKAAGRPKPVLHAAEPDRQVGRLEAAGNDSDPRRDAGPSLQT